jgi:pyrroline-5-carboxylate reductase
MKICVIGTGRMGRLLAARMATENEVVVYDANCKNAKAVAEALQLKVLESLEEMDADAVVLAVPDSAVSLCITELHKTQKLCNVFSVATNISREMLSEMAGETTHCLNVKIIGHAGEMSRGARPVMVVDEGNSELTLLARQVFAAVGAVVVGKADCVQQINSVATEEALKASVAIEQRLHCAGVTDPELIRGALSQVAPGVLRAYSEDDLGPFARGIIKSLRDRADTKMV